MRTAHLSVLTALGIAAYQPVPAQNPQILWQGHRLFRRVGYGVWIRQTTFGDCT